MRPAEPAICTTCPIPLLSKSCAAVVFAPGLALSAAPTRDRAERICLFSDRDGVAPSDTPFIHSTMISRIWRGWTTPEHAAAYQALLLETIVPGIREHASAGFRGMRVDRRAVPGTPAEVEFVTTMLFDTLDDVIAFAGEAYVVAVVPSAARAVLTRFDPESAHYEVVGDFVSVPSARTV